MATDTLGDSERAAENAPRTSTVRPWIAAVLSVLVPGLGQAFVRRYARALAWFSPIVVLSLLAMWTLNLTLTDLVAAALETNVLWGLFWVNIAGALWRLGAAVDAFKLASGVVVGDTSFVIGWAVVALLIVAPHLLIGRYTMDAITLVSSVLVEEPASTSDPVIPIGTDADIVPDPIETVPEPGFEEALNPDASDVRVPAERGDEATERMKGERERFMPFSERNEMQRITVLIAGGDAGPAVEACEPIR